MNNLRKTTKTVQIKDKFIGGNHKILIQSMTNTKTKDVLNTVKQINTLEKAGCEIIRVAVLDLEDAKAIKEIKKNISIPLVADIHFDYRLAIEAINAGADKIRLNPGNISNEEHIKQIVNLCKEKNIPIRIGVNSGSLPKGLELTPENLVKAAKYHVNILEKLDFHNIVLSLKASNIDLAVKAYELASQEFNYPLHIGITEAGSPYAGAIKSAIGLGILLNEGIGDTIRVSITGDPLLEIKAAKEILNNFGLIEMPTLTSCPTCGRTDYDMIPLVNKVEEYLLSVNKKIHIAIMGCVVNGPGEAKEADLGIAGGKNEGLLFKKGVPVRKIKQEDLYDELIKEIENF